MATVTLRFRPVAAAPAPRTPVVQVTTEPPPAPTIAAAPAAESPRYPCRHCGHEIGFDAPSGVCSTDCLNAVQGFQVAHAELSPRLTGEAFKAA